MVARVARIVLIGTLIVLVGATAATRLIRTQCAMASSERTSCCPPKAHQRAAAKARQAPRPTPSTPVKIGVGDCCSVMSVSTTSAPPSMLASPPPPAAPPVQVASAVMVPPPPRVRPSIIVPVAVGPPPRSPRAQSQIWLL